MLKTYIVLPNFIVTNQLLELAIDAIKSFKKYSDAIVITVDDGSTMDVTKLINVSDYYLKNKENKGFAPTCNRGIRWVLEHEPDDCYIIVANNDIEINKNVVPALKEPFEKYKNVAFSGIPSYKEKNPDHKPMEEQYLDEMTQGGLIRGWMQDGGLVCSKKSVFEKIGLYDERFIRGGYEDVDLFLRARDTFGMKLVMNGHAAFWHKQGATRWNCEIAGEVRNFSLESKDIEGENLKRFMEKWGFDPQFQCPWKSLPIN